MKMLSGCLKLLQRFSVCSYHKLHVRGTFHCYNLAVTKHGWPSGILSVSNGRNSPPSAHYSTTSESFPYGKKRRKTWKPYQPSRRKSPRSLVLDYLSTSDISEPGAEEDCGKIEGAQVKRSGYEMVSVDEEEDFGVESLAKDLEQHLYLEDAHAEDEEWDDTGEPKHIFSGPDPSSPISNVPCSGCGAMLHCQNPGIKGYVPAAKYKSVPTHMLKQSDMLCQRCLMLIRFDVNLDASVSPEEYKEIISQIHDVHALVLVVVDVMDMPSSLYRGLSQLIGLRRPLYIIGNKVDLLPRDSTGYLERTKDMLYDACMEAGLGPNNYIQHVALVSAKTGYGVEDLISKLMKDWHKKGENLAVRSALLKIRCKDFDSLEML